MPYNTTALRTNSQMLAHCFFLIECQHVRWHYNESLNMVSYCVYLVVKRQSALKLISYLPKMFMK